MLFLALAWLALRPAEAARVFVDATIRSDLQTVVGTIRVEGEGIRFVDPQSLLPLPADDRERRRTFPGAPQKGWIHLEPLGDNSSYAFHSILPARYDATGKVPGRGLYANGLWLPQPVTGSSLAQVDWVVDLALPEGSVAIMNGVAGTKQMHWSGTAERVALAVIPHAYASFLTLPEGQVAVVSDRHISSRTTDRLEAILIDAWPSEDPPSFMVVVSPLRRRLVRTAPGMLFLSDRAMRLTDGLWQYHVAAVRKGLLEAGLTAIADPFERAFAATAIADARAAQPDANRLLGWASWVPLVDSLLYSGTLPFYSEVFDETYPADPLADDLAELIGPEQQPPRAVVRMIDARFGAGTSEQIARRLVTGESFEAALGAVGVPRDLVSEWRRAGPEENLHLEVQRDDDTWTARVERDVTVDAPSIAVPIRVDGVETVWLASPGADDESWTFDAKPKIVVDPQGIVRQSRMDDDRFPRRWTVVVSALPYEFDVGSGRISAYADVSFRRRYDTRWVYNLVAFTDHEDILGFDAGVHRYFGPLLDRRARPLRLSLLAGTAILDPEFRPTEGENVALDAALAMVWDTRVEDLLPTNGHNITISTTGGLVPSSDETWSSLSLRALGLAPLAGRVTAAGRVVGAIATGDVAHRLLTLGGTGDVQAIPTNRVVGDRKVGGAVELRWNAIRNASVPLYLLWGSDLQISAGIDQGVLWSDDEQYSALGWTGGLFVAGDLLGAQPAGIGVWVAGPLVWAPDELVDDRSDVQIYIRLDQAL